MRRLVIGILLLLIFLANPVAAQTDTPTPIVTPTPEVYIAWTLPAYDNDAGTPVPAQDVIFGYSFNAGDVAIVLPGAMILISIWAMAVIVLLLNRGNNAGGA